MGDIRTDEQALIRALEVLETSRSAWLAELHTFADRRRVEKREHRRSPTAADRLSLHGHRWPGPDSHTAVLHEAKRLWTEHLSEPFPQTPVEAKGDLVYLDSTVAGCVSTYFSRGGQTAIGHRDILLGCLADVTVHLRHLGYPTTYYTAVGYFRRLKKLSELIISDAVAA